MKTLLLFETSGAPCVRTRYRIPEDWLKKKSYVIPLQAGVAQKVGRGIALLFRDLGTRRGEWSAARPHPRPGIDPVPIVQDVGWAPGPVWTGAENLAPHRDSIPGPSSPVAQSLYRRSYRAHPED
jgi:hypothetical protein